MKKIIAAAAVILSLAGCVAVPVYQPAPAYGYYYGPPAVTFSFGYHHGYQGDNRHHHRHHHRNGR